MMYRDNKFPAFFDVNPTKEELEKAKLIEGMRETQRHWEKWRL